MKMKKKKKKEEKKKKMMQATPKSHHLISQSLSPFLSQINTLEDLAN